MTAAHEIISGDPALGEGELVALARRCWQKDGGLPLAVEPWFVRGRWFRPGTKTFTVRGAPAENPAGDALLAAIAIRPGPQGPVITGLVDPVVRRYGIGSRLLDAALASALEFETTGAASTPAARGGVAVAGSVPVAGGGVADAGMVPAAEGVVAAGESEPGAAAAWFVTVETEGLSPDAEKLFESRGLRQFFAEEVMRIDLTAAQVPEPAWPARTTVAEWDEETAERFFRVYAASFRERPGFPDPSAAEWIEDTAEDDDFRPERSLLATLPEIGDAGFVSVGDNWIQQVGVVPAARRTGLGGALIREALRRMASADLGEGWLCVNVDNPAASLYRRIGFAGVGYRARYRLDAS
jgi:mycothiol synthase